MTPSRSISEPCGSPSSQPRATRRRETLRRPQPHAPAGQSFRFGSVCSGMEAASLAWEPLGWECAFVSEIDKAPCDLLEQRIDAPNLGDMTKFEEWPDYAIDLLVGGTPCQSFSVAGLRKGLADPRGSLMLTYGAIAKRYRPRWLVWENVPGVLSDDGGRSFGTFLGMLGELGYGFAYRVLDAQYFGLAQRRARVFVVGYLGDWRPPAAVLFESESLRGDPAPRRETGERVAPTIAARTRGGGGLGTDFDCDGGLVSHCLMGKPNDSQDPTMQTYVAHSLRADGFDASEDGTGRGTPLVPVAFSCKDHGADAGDLAPTLRAMGHDGSHANAGGQLAIAYGIGADAVDRSGECADGSAAGRAGLSIVEEVQPTIRCRGRDSVAHGVAVRRLTPKECERLQGAPDDWTNITRKGKPIADGPRYKMLGNSMAVPVMRWIGERIELVAAHIPKTKIKVSSVVAPDSEPRTRTSHASRHNRPSNEGSIYPRHPSTDPAGAG